MVARRRCLTSGWIQTRRNRHLQGRTREDGPLRKVLGRSSGGPSESLQRRKGASRIGKSRAAAAAAPPAGQNEAEDQKEPPPDLPFLLSRVGPFSVVKARAYCAK